MITTDLISIIMPSYNSAPFILDAIHSVQAQTYKEWELIFVDDCSRDGTKEIVESIKDPRIRFFQNPQNSGAAVSRNRGLKEAKGRWIAFLDSDDMWEPDKLEKQVRFMEENGYSFSYTKYQEMDESGQELGVLVSGPKHISKAGMFSYCWPGCLTVMYDAEKIGLIQIENIKKNNDYAMWLKVCRKADCYLLPEYLAYYRKRSGSISHHSYSALIKWHYKLFHDAEKMNLLASLWHTGVNLLCGFYKKLHYVKTT